MGLILYDQWLMQSCGDCLSDIPELFFFAADTTARRSGSTAKHIPERRSARTSQENHKDLLEVWPLCTELVLGS